MEIWYSLDILHKQLADNYFGFSREKKKDLEIEFNIDCGTDYADHIFNNAECLDFYNGN
jgi:hypothetical protein